MSGTQSPTRQSRRSSTKSWKTKNRASIKSNTADLKRISAKDDHPIQILPKKPGQKGRTVMHCLEDACIMVRVNSDDSVLTRANRSSKPDNPQHTESDDSLEAYHAMRAKERRKSSTSSTSFNAKKEEELGLLGDATDETDENDTYIQDKVKEGINKAKIASEEDILFEDNDCTEFLDHISFAKQLVSNVVDESEANAEEKQIAIPETPSDSKNTEIKNTEDFFFHGYRESEQFDYVETKKSEEIKWPSVEDFTIELGAYAIDEYLSYFETEEDWMYVIYFQGTEHSQCSELYKYQAIYSLPTWKYPVAQATASLYFTIEVCKAKPPDCTVDVTYRYESYRQVQRPGQYDFNEKWLHYILDSKIKFFQTVTY